MATGKISYHDDSEWIFPEGSEDEVKAKYIVRSIQGIAPIAIGEEFTIGKTLTKKKELQGESQVQETYNWTLKEIKDHIAQIEVKYNGHSESRNPEKFVDEIEHFNSSSEGFLEINIDTRLILKSITDMEYEHRTMTLIPILSERVSTFSNSSKIHFTTKIVE